MTLVLIFQRGGADGLSLVAPVDDPVYRAARPTLALDPASSHRLGGTLALHGAANRLAGLWDQGALSLVHAVGFDGQSRSHFGAQATLETGAAPAADELPSGWLGRALATRAGSEPNPFRAIVVHSPSVAPTLWGTTDALAINELDTAGLGRLTLRGAGGGRRGEGGGIARSRLSPAPRAVAAAWEEGQGPAAVGTATAVSVLDRLERLTPGGPPAGSAFGDSATGRAVEAAAGVLAAGVGAEVVMVNVSGWDTHQAQDVLPEGDEDGAGGGTFSRLVSDLDGAIGALIDHERAAGRPVTVMVMTEFGRRLAENSSRGTDHGRGSLVLIAGDGVAPGLHGVWPGLDQLDQGDLRAVNNARAIQAEVAAKRLGVEHPDRVITGVTAGDWLGVLA